jgi:integrase/recombinase XerD
MTGSQPNALARTLRQFFADHLPGLRGVSRHTIDSYRYALILLLRFLATSHGRSVAELDLVDIAAEDVITFLAHLEDERHNTVATRNVRLAALHAFFRYVAASEPEQLARSQRILQIPFKRADQRPIDYLEYAELQAVLEAVERSTGAGRRDYALLATMFNTGARVQELLDLRTCDLHLDRPCQVRLFGKGRKERMCPLWPQTATLLRELCAERHLALRAAVPIFVNQRGQPLSRFGVRYILAKYLKRAQVTMPSLTGKHLHPHSMRHSTAVHLLKSGVDLSTIGQWLGHTSLNTTNKYATIDLDLKR